MASMIMTKVYNGRWNGGFMLFTSTGYLFAWLV